MKNQTKEMSLKPGDVVLIKGDERTMENWSGGKVNRRTRWHSTCGKIESWEIDQPTARILVNGTPIKALIDSGASVNLLDEATFHTLKIKPTLKRSTTRITAYCAKKPLKTQGTFTAEVESKSRITIAVFHVVSGNSGSLLSYQTAKNLAMIHINHVSRSSTETDLLRQYDHLFHGIGQVKTPPIKLHINESVPTVAQPHRRILQKVEEKLQRQEKLDIIEKANGPTPWVSPIVVVPKPKKPEKIHICVDMRSANTA